MSKLFSCCSVIVLPFLDRQLLEDGKFLEFSCIFMNFSLVKLLRPI